MTKNSKCRLMLTTLLLSLLAFSSAYASLMPNVKAADPNIQDKTLSILNDVVGLKTELYNTTQSIQRDSQYLSFPQKEADINLASAQGNLRVTCSYVKDTLQLVYLSDLKGELALKQSANNTVEMAKGLLERYQKYADDSFYSELASMLDDVDANVDVTKVARNVKLEVSGSDPKSVSYMWTFIDENGVVAERKNIILLYEDGQLKGFFNNWPLYTIVSTPKISAQQATAIAIDASKNYSYPVTAENGTKKMVSGFSIAQESLGYAKLVYLNSKEQDYARGGDPFTLYPAWYVPLGFDRFYPGDVSGLTVILWADSGEVCGMNRVIVDSGFASSFVEEAVAGEDTYLQLPEQQPAALPTPVVGAAWVIGVVCVSLGACKKPKLTGSKKLSSKGWAMLLCASIIFSVIFVAVPQVRADSPTGKSRIYGIGGDGNWTGYLNGTADSAEGNASREVCNYIGNASEDIGYSTSNLYGSGTIKADVMSNAYSDEHNYQGTMVFHVGHRSMYGYQDNNGTDIRPSDILGNTELGKHFFVFIWVCDQAPDKGVSPNSASMAAAWTHRDGTSGHPLMDSDGFGSNSDGLGQCYISFYGFSPMISDYPPVDGNRTFYEYSQTGDLGPVKEFIIFFYYYALNQGYSVCDALDLASQAYFGCDYADTVLNTGYNSWWPGGEEWQNISGSEWLQYPGYFPRDYTDYVGDRSNNSMRVFGDSSIKLYQPLLTVNAWEYPSYVSVNVKIDGESVGTSGNGWRVIPGEHEIQVDASYSGHPFYYFGYEGYCFYSNPATITMTSDSTITAYYISNFPPYGYCLMIYAEGGGTTDPEPDTWHPSYGETIEVTAYPFENRVFDHWILDGEDAGTDNPIDVEMGVGDRVLTAYFTPVWNLTISAGEGGTTDPEPGTYQYGDDTVVEVAADADQGSSFSYWLLDDEYVYTSETIYVTMDGNRELEAHFDEQLPPCEVGVIAVEYCTQEPVPTPVYIDSEYVGYAFSVYEVTIGEEHSIEGDYEVYVPNLGSNVYEWYVLVDDEFYDYGCYAEVTPTQLHMTVTFVYIWQ